MKEFKRKINEDTSITYRLGTNSKENHLIIDEADKDDWWFHLDGFPSGHCIIERIEIDYEDIEFASEIVVRNSKLKNSKNVKICYTQVKNLKKTKNPGEVLLLKSPKIYYFKNTRV